MAPTTFLRTNPFTSPSLHDVFLAVNCSSYTQNWGAELASCGVEILAGLKGITLLRVRLPGPKELLALALPTPGMGFAAGAGAALRADPGDAHARWLRDAIETSGRGRGPQ